jgi:hypothetical protein
MSVYDEIQVERGYQDSRWGTANDDKFNTPWMWVAYIARYSTTWMNGQFLPVGDYAVNNFRASMVKVAAIAVAAVESIDRQRIVNGKTFYE